MSIVLHTATLSYLYYDNAYSLADVHAELDHFESDDDVLDRLEQNWRNDALEKKISTSEEKKQKHRENEEIERKWRKVVETEELLKERQRRETNRRQRGSVEFVHPDLKDELKKQGEDPNNPWVWLTSYSRIPVTLSITLSR